MINSILIPISNAIISDGTGLKIGQEYYFKVTVNNMESIECIISPYQSLSYFNLLQMLNRKLNHYGIHVKFKDGLSFELDGKSLLVSAIDPTFEIPGKDLDVKAVDLFGNLL